MARRYFVENISEPFGFISTTSRSKLTQQFHFLGGEFLLGQDAFLKEIGQSFDFGKYIAFLGSL